MNHDDIRAFAASWIQYAEHSQAQSTLWDLCRRDPERAWTIIEAVYQQQPSGDVLGQLAAGPLEDLLSQHGEQFIERVERLGYADERFLPVLTGLWQQGMSDEVWQRIQRVIGRWTAA